MGELLIRNMDDALIEQLRAQAAVQNQSLEQRVREIVSGAIHSCQEPVKVMSKEELVAEMYRIRAMTPPTPSGVQWPTTEAMIREDRDNRETWR